MGVVYEAEQISLGRHVALKVLPFAGMLDAKQVQRFKNEAYAAAKAAGRKEGRREETATGDPSVSGVALLSARKRERKRA
jgi:serine/threonine protein kinase